MATAKSLPVYVCCISRLSGTVLIFLIWFAFWAIFFFDISLLLQNGAVLVQMILRVASSHNDSNNNNEKYKKSFLIHTHVL